MKKPLLLALLTLNVNTAYAGFNNVEIASYRSGRSVPVSSYIERDADYAVATLRFSSSTSSLEQRTAEFKSFIDSLNEQALSVQGLELGEEMISISPIEKRKSANASSSSINLYYTLNENANIYDAANIMNGLLQQIKPPRSVSYNLSHINLAVQDPQQYRERLLGVIGDEIKATKKALSGGYKAVFSGLDNPVTVRQKNERQVVLFIDYKLQFEQ